MSNRYRDEGTAPQAERTSSITQRIPKKVSALVKIFPGVSPAKALIGYASVCAITALCTMVPNTMVYMIPLFMFLVFFLSMLSLPFGGLMTLLAGLGTTAVFIWYFILTFTMKEVRDVPDTWYNLNYVIGGLAAIHCVLIALGASEKKNESPKNVVYMWFFMATWITMALLVALLTMQHVTVTYFKTDG